MAAALIDVDWDDILPEGPAGPAVLEIRQNVEEAIEAADAQSLVRRCPEPRNSRWTVKLPPPRQRSRAEHCLAAARMRDSKARLRHVRQKFNIARAIQDAFSKLRQCGALRDRCKSRAKLSMKNALVIEIADKRQKRMPMEVLQVCAFCASTRRNEAARALELSPKTVVQMRNLVAAAAMGADSNFMQSLATKFEAQPPLIFAVGFMADATSQQLVLPMVGLENYPGVARSSWHVLVSDHRFSWVDCEESGWTKCDFVRPNIALTSSESSETIHAAAYHQPQLSAFTALETSGLGKACFGFLHFDLDGHSANPGFVAQRRQEICDATGAAPMVSRFHCGNHCENLIEVATGSAIGGDMYGFCSTGASFFRMGGNFIRSIQACALEIGRNMSDPIVGHPAAFAKELGDELQDYAIKNHRYFVESTSDEPWSSGSDNDHGRNDDDGARAKKRNARRSKYLYRESWRGFRSVFNGDIWSTNCVLAYYDHTGLRDKSALIRDGVKFANEVLFSIDASEACQKQMDEVRGLSRLVDDGHRLSQHAGACVAIGIFSHLGSRHKT